MIEGSRGWNKWQRSKFEISWATTGTLILSFDGILGPSWKEEMCRTDIKYFQILFAYRKFSFVCLENRKLESVYWNLRFDFNNCGCGYLFEEEEICEQLFKFCTM